MVEIDESKFGKRKYNRGRMVEGTWVLGGIERETNHCFLTSCPANRRNEATLLPIIQQFVLPGTKIITDGWKAYINLGQHGYVHMDVNHSEDFVNPATGAHTNRIEGTWTHAKYKAINSLTSIDTKVGTKYQNVSSETCEPPSILNHNDEQRYMIPAQDFKIRDGHESTSSDLIPM